jgi:hypothetical protein
VSLLVLWLSGCLVRGVSGYAPDGIQLWTRLAISLVGNRPIVLALE